MNKIEIEIPDGYFFDKETMSIKKLPEPEFVYVDTPKQKFEYVDLGLPSGTKWATCNVGAKKDTDFGNYLSFESAQKYNCPSKEQMEELITNTTSLWIVKNEVNGRLFIGKNGNFIFLPAAGYRYGGDLYLEGSYGRYWSSTPLTGSAYSAYGLYFNSGGVRPYYLDYRCIGFSVRPVSK